MVQCDVFQEMLLLHLNLAHQSGCDILHKKRIHNQIDEKGKSMRGNLRGRLLVCRKEQSNIAHQSWL